MALTSTTTNTSGTAIKPIEEPKLSLGGDGSGVQMPSPTFNYTTGQYDYTGATPQQKPTYYLGTGTMSLSGDNSIYSNNGGLTGGVVGQQPTMTEMAGDGTVQSAVQPGSTTFQGSTDAGSTAGVGGTTVTGDPAVAGTDVSAMSGVSSDPAATTGATTDTSRLPLETANQIDPTLVQQLQDGTISRALMDAIGTGDIPYSSLTSEQKGMALRYLDGVIAEDPNYWYKITDKEARQAYMQQHGDPQVAVKGSEFNTQDRDGSIQGQYEAPQGGAYTGEAAIADENTRAMTEQELADEQLRRITSQDSPLMQLAKQDGINMANSRGLTNSSLAAGASMAEMTRAATPLAQQNAAQAFGMEQQNQQLESQRRAINAGMETDVSMGNAGMANDLLNSDRQREITYELQQLAGDQDFAKQELASNTAREISIIEGNFKQLISVNDTAARIVTQLNDSIAQVVGNEKIKSGEAATKIEAIIKAANDSLAVIGAMNELDLSNLVLGGTGDSVSDLPSNIEVRDGVTYIDGEPIDYRFSGRLGI